MAIPLTNKQLPDNSILDVNGKQTYLGNTFALPNTGKALASTAETPSVVITNPTGSDKSIFIYSTCLYSDLNPTIVRLYSNPVLNVPGSATLPVKTRSGATLTSISVCYLGSSITSNGTLVTALPAPPYGLCSNFLYVIDPGNSVLYTIQQSLAGTSNVLIDAVWYEI